MLNLLLVLYTHLNQGRIILVIMMFIVFLMVRIIWMILIMEPL